MTIKHPARAIPLAGFFLAWLSVSTASAEEPIVLEPAAPEAPSSNAECEALSDAYRAVTSSLQKTRMQIRPRGKQVPTGPCCEEWAGAAATKIGVCQTFESDAAADEAWYCAVLRRDAAVKTCYAKVDATREATGIALAFANFADDPSLAPLKSALRETVSFAVALSPAASFARDCYEAATGKGVLTGEPLSAGERLMALLGVASAGATRTAEAVLHRMEALRAAGKIRTFERASDTLETLIKETDATINITRREFAAALNARLPSPGYGSDAFVGTTKEELRLYRVHASPDPIRPGADSLFSMQVIPGPATTAALRDAFALPTAPNYQTEFAVPAGREVRISLVAKNAKFGSGGKIQYEILAPESDLRSWMRSTEPWLPAGQPQMK